MCRNRQRADQNPTKIQVLWDGRKQVACEDGLCTRLYLSRSPAVRRSQPVSPLSLEPKQVFWKLGTTPAGCSNHVESVPTKHLQLAMLTAPMQDSGSEALETSLVVSVAFAMMLVRPQASIPTLQACVLLRSHGLACHRCLSQVLVSGDSCVQRGGAFPSPGLSWLLVWISNTPSGGQSNHVGRPWLPVFKLGSCAQRRRGPVQPGLV